MFRLPVDVEIDLAMPLDVHAEPLFRLVDAERERIGAWLIAWDDVRSVADQREVLRRRRAGLGELRNLSFVIEYRRQVAGTIGFSVDSERTHVAELGYMPGERFEGRGIVTRSVAAVIDAAIDRLDVQRFEIRCATENARSPAVPRRLGFTEEGVLRRAGLVSGVYQDEVLYALLADEWPGRGELAESRCPS